MRRAFQSVAATLLLAGCGATEIGTPATKDKEPQILARVRVPVHQDGLRGQWEPAHLQGVEVDGETRDFWLLPGPHRIHPRYEDCLLWPTSWVQVRIEERP
jgi:hypothetical protein